MLIQQHKLRDYLTERVSDLAGREVPPAVAQAWATIATVLVVLSVVFILIRLGLAKL